MELKSFLLWISTVGAGTIAYELIEHVKWLAARPSTEKPWWAYGIAAALAMLGFGLTVAMGYREAPLGAVAWVESLFTVGTTAFGLSQLIYKNVARAK